MDFRPWESAAGVKVALMRRSLPSDFWVREARGEMGAGAGGVGCAPRAGAAGGGPRARRRGPLRNEKGLALREASARRPVFLLKVRERSAAMAVRVSGVSWALTEPVAGAVASAWASFPKF